MNARTDLHPAAGWLAIAAVVLGWDAVNGRSLTSLARGHKRCTWLLGGVVVGHLGGVLPVALDPFTYLGYALRAKTPTEAG